MAGDFRICEIENSFNNSSTRSLDSALLFAHNSETAEIFCSTFKPRKILASCGKYPRPNCALRYIGRFVASKPSTVTLPLSGLIRPAIE